MKLSTGRILTTHAGSLPRPKPLTDMLLAKDRGEAYDEGGFAHSVAAAVAAVVRRQLAVGVDIVDDGEMSKPGYSTYIADRLSGFAGRGERTPPLDIKRLSGLQRGDGADDRRAADPPCQLRRPGDHARSASRCAPTSPICARRSMARRRRRRS